MTRPDIQTWALDLADLVRTRSRDPSTKIGAVILRPDKTIASLGYNGFPRGVRDDEELYNDRQVKLLRTIHGELNAILTAREPLDGYTIYVSPLHPCSNCAAAIIQSGIKKVVARCDAGDVSRWQDSFDQASSMFSEAGIEIVIVDA